MSRKNLFLLLSLSLLVFHDVIAQLNVSATATAASCAANGRVSVSVSGGSGNYTYQLTGPCADNIPPQQEAVFDFLAPCLYTVIVVDRQTNENGKTEVEVPGNYTEMVLSVVAEGCDQRLVVSGGRSPFRYSFSPDGVEGPYQVNNPPGSALFSNLSGSDIHLSVEDACGIRRAIPTTALPNGIRDLKFPEMNEEGIVVAVTGGNGNYSFRLFNETDTFALNRAFIPWDSLICDAQLEVRDSCSTLVKPVDYVSNASTLCVNFSAGTAEVTGVQGVAPFSYTVFHPEGEITSATGIFDTLPVNAAYYEFVVTDACGKEQVFDQQTPLRMNADETDLGCTDDVLRMSVARECAGSLFPPLIVTCLNCTPADTLHISSMDQSIEWSGFRAGEWDILLQNECGDQTRCRDELILELTPGCDSIVARVVDLFTCDNGTISRRVITGDDASFSLLDENGVLLVQNNQTGRFDNLAPGTYEVVAILPNCDTLRSTATLAPPETIDPALTTRVDYAEEDGACRLFYNIDIAKDQGPYVLSGGPDGEYHQVLNNFGEDSCPTYGVRLRPGVYTLTSMSLCGSRILELPEPDYDFAVSLVDNCPGDAKVLADGARTVDEWKSYFQPYNLNVTNLFADYYRLGAGATSRRENDFTFRGLDTATYVFLLYAMEEQACPIDTVEIEVTEYDPVEIGLVGDVVCDNDNTTDLDIRISGGQGPYELRQLDCENSETLASHVVEAGEIFTEQNVPLGGYCYAVSDVCQISDDFQVKVRLFADSIRFGYTCDGILHLAVDSLPASYTWLDGQGRVVGDRFALSVPAPRQDETFTVQVGLPDCVVERSITVAGREVIPVVEIIYDGIAPVLCGTEPRQLTALTNQENELIWNTGDTSGLLLATQPGIYIVQSSNDLGCVDSDTLDLAQVTPPAPQIDGAPGFCFGESTELMLDQDYSNRLWSTGAQSLNITVAAPGSYAVTVTDENGCTGQDSVFVTEWTLPEPQISADTLICPNASANLSLAQAYAAYAWSDGSEAATATVPAGTYAVTVTDENGCRGQDDIAIAEKPQIYAQLSGDTSICAGDSALLSLSFTQPWYDTDVRILGTAGEDVRFRTFGDTSFWLTVDFSTDLSLESVVMEAYGCPVIPQGMPRIIANRVNLVLAETSISCPGGSDGALEVFAASNFPPYDISWSNGQTTSAIGNLAEGLYRVSVRDQLGCASVDSFFLRAPQPIAPSLAALPPLCRDIDDGIISLDAVRGGTPPYVWQVNGREQGRAPGEAVGLPAGTYFLSLQDQNNCLWDTTLVFPIPPPLILDLGEDQTIVIGETVRLDPVTNLSGLSYWRWEANPTMDLPDTTLVLEVQPFEKTNFTLTVGNDYGCELTDRISVFVNKDSQFDAPTAFSPNGDGRNDYFVLYGQLSNIELIEQFEIYDRWGNKLFETNGMELNNELTGWDGRLNGQLVSTGVYVWMARVKRIDGEVVMAYGDVALLR